MSKPCICNTSDFQARSDQINEKQRPSLQFLISGLKIRLVSHQFCQITFKKAKKLFLLPGLNIQLHLETVGYNLSAWNLLLNPFHVTAHIEIA